MSKWKNLSFCLIIHLELQEDRNMSENGNDFLANNNGIVKTKKGLVLVIIGILGFIGYLGVVTVGIYLVVAG